MTEALDGVRTSRISRRTVLKGGAVVAGTLWVAPVIESMTTPAFAQSVSTGISWVVLQLTCTSGEDGGTDTYRVKLDHGYSPAFTCSDSSCSGGNAKLSQSIKSGTCYEEWSISLGPSKGTYSQSGVPGNGVVGTVQPDGSLLVEIPLDCTISDWIIHSGNCLACSEDPSPYPPGGGTSYSGPGSPTSTTGFNYYTFANFECPKVNH